VRDTQAPSDILNLLITLPRESMSMSTNGCPTNSTEVESQQQLPTRIIVDLTMSDTEMAETPTEASSASEFAEDSSPDVIMSRNAKARQDFADYATDEYNMQDKSYRDRRAACQADCEQRARAADGRRVPRQPHLRLDETKKETRRRGLDEHQARCIANELLGKPHSNYDSGEEEGSTDSEDNMSEPRGPEVEVKQCASFEVKQYASFEVKQCASFNDEELRETQDILHFTRISDQPLFSKPAADYALQLAQMFSKLGRKLLTSQDSAEPRCSRNCASHQQSDIQDAMNEMQKTYEKRKTEYLGKIIDIYNTEDETYQLRLDQCEDSAVYILTREGNREFHHSTCWRPAAASVNHYNSAWKEITLQEALDSGLRGSFQFCCKDNERYESIAHF
jgi:hypothetical protein